MAILGVPPPLGYAAGWWINHQGWMRAVGGFLWLESMLWVSFGALIDTVGLATGRASVF